MSQKSHPHRAEADSSATLKNQDNEPLPNSISSRHYPRGLQSQCIGRPCRQVFRHRVRHPRSRVDGCRFSPCCPHLRQGCPDRGRNTPHPVKSPRTGDCKPTQGIGSPLPYSVLWNGRNITDYRTFGQQATGGHELRPHREDAREACQDGVPDRAFRGKHPPTHPQGYRLPGRGREPHRIE